ncbi:cell wall-binding protein [Clostridium sp. MCC353]|uniref:N-acetylmuramoyl-L-alanine amidase family protein n=1 Tax=Clostridium sp. MCC353 TaxID=2592646 RepID=UPI001C02149C|nr:cell wall-binding protein [Clostridium sp. MCC353]MBT9777881.1 cell wall-binding protein [Clostridium sp. MCC353]
MRKQTKLVAVLSAAALLAIGASMTSFAATGWAEEDGTWVYYDRDGERVTDEWKKSGSNWFYLDEDGYMATDVLIEDDDDYYYVDENGVMVTNLWVSIENEEKDDDDDPDNWWYYFGSNGKAYKRSDSASNDVSLKTINGKKYTFDEEGKMQFGWVADGERQTDDDAWQNCDYYFGDENDGAMTVGWREIHIVDENYEGSQPNDDIWDEDQDRWFWFKSSGKKQTDSVNKNINGKKYGFDEYGRMIAEWYTETTYVDKDTTATASDGSLSVKQGNSSYTEGFMYFNSPESGARYTKGWFKVTPGYYLQQGKYEDGDSYWYYADGNGNLYANVIKNINGKKYLFDNYGRMKSGLRFVHMAKTANNVISSTEVSTIYADDADNYPYDTEDGFDAFVNHYMDEINSGEIRCYFLGDGSDGSMKTGKQNVVIDGDTFAFEFEKSGSRKGAGKNGLVEKDDKLYLAGKTVKADKDDKYQIYAIKADDTVVKMDVEDFLTFCDDTTTSLSTSKQEDGDKQWTFKAGKNDFVDAKFYLVNTSGKVIDSKSNCKDGNDYKFEVKNRKIVSVLLEG